MGSTGGEDANAFGEAPVEAVDGKSVRFTLSKGETGGILWTFVGVAVFLLAVSLFFAWRDGTGVPWGEIIIFMLCLSIPVSVALWVRRRAHNDRSAHLVISTAGILAPKATDRLVPWDALEKITFHEDYYKGQRRNVFMALHLHYPDRFEAIASNWMRKINRWWYGTDIVFPLEALVGSPEDVKVAVSRFAPADLLARSDLSLDP